MGGLTNQRLAWTRREIIGRVMLVGVVDRMEFLRNDPPGTELLREKVQTGRPLGGDEFVQEALGPGNDVLFRLADLEKGK